MKRARRDKRYALLLTFYLLIFAIAFTVGSFMTFKSALYVVMLVSCALAAICYYAFSFSFFRYLDAKSAVQLLHIMGFDSPSKDRSVMTLAEISEAMGWKKKSTKRFIEKCKKRGYMS